MYRLVSDYGYGDKSWVERWLSEEDMLDELFSRGLADEDTTIEDALNMRENGSTYYIEEDSPGDVEDWDWMSS